MEQIELFTVESPCRGVCKTSSKGFCVGCLRSREERFHWHSMTNVDKRKTIQRCKGRWQKLLKACEVRIEEETRSRHHLPYGMSEADIQLSLEHIDDVNDQK